MLVDVKKKRSLEIQLGKSYEEVSLEQKKLKPGQRRSDNLTKAIQKLRKVQSELKLMELKQIKSQKKENEEFKNFVTERNEIFKFLEKLPIAKNTTDQNLIFSYEYRIEQMKKTFSYLEKLQNNLVSVTLAELKAQEESKLSQQVYYPLMVRTNNNNKQQVEALENAKRKMTDSKLTLTNSWNNTDKIMEAKEEQQLMVFDQF